MKTIAQWKTLLPDLRRILKNTEARERRAQENRWGDFVECKTCGNSHRGPVSAKADAKYTLETDLGWKQRTYIYAIQNWLYTLKAYNKGEPVEPS